MSTEAPPSTPELPGYRFLEPLDQGGMATLWLAERLCDRRLEVVKRIQPELRARPASYQRFVREAALTCSIDHPRLVRGLRVGETEEGPFLALEYVPGCTLEDFRRRWSGHQVPAEVAVGITLQVLEGLEYAHGLLDGDGAPLRFVHRDLTPRNVMLDFEGQVRLIDFGLARATLGDFRTEPGMTCGTPRYMSPEQALAQDDLDARSDLYTVAAVLYELLTGQPTAAQGSLTETLLSVAHDEPLPATEHCPGLPPALVEVLARALGKAPEARFGTAKAFAEALVDSLPEVSSPKVLAEMLRVLFPERYGKERARAEAQDLEDTLPTQGPLPGLLTSAVLMDARPTDPTAPAPRTASRRDDSKTWGRAQVAPSRCLP